MSQSDIIGFDNPLDLLAADWALGDGFVGRLI